MGGGLLQLVAYGAQDAYLSGNPQITFWKSLFKRHTNFAMEPFRINLSGEADWGVKHSAIIGRHADLLYSTYIEVVLPPDNLFNNDKGRLGYNLVEYVELDIGGQLIDRLYGEWLFLWDCLSSDVQTGTKLSHMVGLSDTTAYYGRGPQGNSGFTGPTNFGVDPSVYVVPNPALCTPGSGRLPTPTVCYIPLTFFFTKNPGAALPLIALQYHEVKLNIQWNSPQEIAGDYRKGQSTPGRNGTNGAYPQQPVQAAVYIDYIYLDTEERRRFAQQSHEYLIEQTQYNEDQGITSYSNRIDLTFNHPVKELVWVVQPSRYTDCSLQTQFINGPQNEPDGTTPTYRLKPFTYDLNPVYEQWLQINGQDRLDKRYGDYYTKVQPYQHHTGSFNPITDFNAGLVGDAGGASKWQKGAYMYSFALRPEEHQPSGTCNFSRIDTATIVLNLAGADASSSPSAGLTTPPGIPVVVSPENPWNVRVYAVNYNILRIMSGMGGLAYSN